MSMGMSFRMVQQCTICGEDISGHAASCPQGLLEKLVDLRKHISCPKCHARDVDVNADDFYECRKCHTQYTCSMLGGDNLEEAILLDYRGNTHIDVRVLTEKGEGRFPYDERCEELGKEVKKLRKKFSRKNKKS